MIERIPGLLEIVKLSVEDFKQSKDRKMANRAIEAVEEIKRILLREISYTKLFDGFDDLDH